MKTEPNIDNFLENGVFFQKTNVKIEKYELELINSLLKSSETLNNLIGSVSFKNVLLLDSNDYYDSYILKKGSSKYILKINSDETNSILLNEAEALKKLSNKNISPELIHFEQNDDLCFLISSYENGISFKKLPINSYIFNLECISKTFSFLHEVTKKEEAVNFTDFISSEINKISYENTFPEDLLKKINEESKAFVRHLPVLKNIKIKLLEESQDISSNFSCLCHLNLDKSKILYRDCMVKFINFESSGFCDPIFDVVLFLYSTSLTSNPNEESRFLNTYYHSFRDFGIEEEHFYDKVKLLKPIAAKFILIKIFFNFFLESVVNQDQRPLKFVNFIKTYNLIKKDLNLSDKDSIVCENVIFNIKSS